MALSVRHSFTSGKTDGLDTTKVRASNWNAEHTLSAAVDRVLGTTSSGTTVTEITCTAAGRALLDDANAAAQKATLSVAEIPVGGSLIWFSDNFPPSNGSVVWGWANGQEISRTTYSVLFSLFSTYYGAGNGSTTFNLPNLAELVPVGVSGMGGAAGRGYITHLANSTITGTVLGEGRHSLTTGEMATHSHGLTDGGHSHSFSGTTGNDSNDHTHSFSYSWSGTTSSDGAHSHSVHDTAGFSSASQTSAGGGSFSGSQVTNDWGTSSDGAHTHTYSGSGSGTTSGISVAHAHAYSGTTGANLQANSGLSVNNAGSGTAHNVVQGSMAVNYLIRLA